MPRHTFFYPEEEYDPVCLDRLRDLTGQGYGEVEIHLHHRNDTPDGLREKLVRFRDVLREQHGLLGETGATAGRARERGQARDAADERRSGGDGVAYGFIHGNWALCNSRPDGDWCGVNEELGILAETGCYADFTFPSAPSPTQPRTVNAIYRALDKPGGRGHDRGTRVVAGSPDAGSPASGLLLIQGPFCLNFARRKWGVLPRLEKAELSGANPPTPLRIGLWTRVGIHVEGRPDWIFVKLHTHGCVPGNADVLLGYPMRRMHETLHGAYNDGVDWNLHYVSAREMANLVLAAEAGQTGDPAAYRDYVIAPPPAARQG
jgi:hypothetical protein